MPLLRVDHAALQGMLPGMWEETGSCHYKVNSVFERAPMSANMLWTIFVVVLLILWLPGFRLPIAAGLINLLLVIALGVLIINLVSGRRVA